MKIAVVHDWLTGMRGGELVLDSILKIFPDADLFTLIYNSGKLTERIEKRNIIPAFTDRLPFKKTKYRMYLPLFPMAIESLDLRGYDLIISSSHCVAKGIIPPPGVPHLTYIHSPMRYVWDMYYDYFPKKNGIKFFLYQMVSSYLRNWDTASSARVDRFISNSDFVGTRIRSYYRRESKTVFPPCLPEGSKVSNTAKEDFYLIVSAFAPYKRIDLALEAFQKSGKRLVVIGGGQDEKKLYEFRVPNITFLKNVSREEIEGWYAKARGFLFPGLEDFGITPVEAQKHCTPVIAFGKGGALETVISGKTGVFFGEQTVESLQKAIDQAEKIDFKPADFQKSINRFTEEKFIKGFKKQVDDLIRPSTSR